MVQDLRVLLPLKLREAAKERAKIRLGITTEIGGNHHGNVAGFRKEIGRRVVNLRLREVQDILMEIEGVLILANGGATMIGEIGAGKSRSPPKLQRECMIKIRVQI